MSSVVRLFITPACLAFLSGAALGQESWREGMKRAMAEAASRQQEAAAAILGARALQEASVARQAQSQPDQMVFDWGPQGSWRSALPPLTGALPEPRPASFDAACDALPAGQARSLVQAAATRAGLQAGLLHAVVEQESAFVPCAVSRKGAQGLMQLMPETASGLGVSDPFDPTQNIDAGARYLKQLLVRYGGQLTLALSAYNAGPARVDRAGGIPEIPETMDYVERVLTKLRRRGGAFPEPEAPVAFD
jgi:soluble lytic murein transglycosylase-like protein